MFTLLRLISGSVIIYIGLCFLRWLLKPLYSLSPLSHLPGPPPQSWLKGNLEQLFNAKGLPFHLLLPERYGGMVKVYGFFGDEQLYISDPRALHSILVKDQDAFEETTVFIETNKVIFGPGLVATTGEQHKRQRKITNFSATQLKTLVPTFYSIAEKLADVLTRESSHLADRSERSVLDMSEWMSRFALETVGQGVLGHSFDPLDSPQNNPYTLAIKELIPTLFSLSLLRQFAPFLSRLGSPAFRRQIVEWTPHKAVQKVKYIADVMHETAQSILKEKRENLSHEGKFSSGTWDQKDIISRLLRENEKVPENEKLSDTELTGQMTVLIFGGQDTTSSTLSRILFELSRREQVQEQVRQEIMTALRERRDSGDFSGRLDYDMLLSLPWLDAVVKESLRLHPPVPFVRRTAVEDRVIPYTPSQDSDVLSSILIRQGTTIFVSIAGANRLKSVWGLDAQEWKPERWMSEPSGSTVKIPGIYAGTLSFLGGGRACIGYKFALTEIKILLVVLLSRFRFSATSDKIVWNLSQIIAPSVQQTGSDGHMSEEKGLPLLVEPIGDF